MKCVTFTTEGSLPLCINLIESAKKVGIENDMIVYCLDEISYNSLKGENSCDIKIFNSKDIRGNFHEYGRDDFRKVTVSKIQIILRELKEHGSLVYTDCDVVFVKNPFIGVEHFNKENKDIDIFFATDFPFMDICTGFMYVKNTDAVHLLFKKYFELNEYFKKQGSECMYDQEIIDRILKENILEEKINFKIFPLEFVINGHVYFNEPEDGITNRRRSGHESVIHCNFCIGIENKIKRFKKENLWFVKEKVVNEESN